MLLVGLIVFVIVYLGIGIIMQANSEKYPDDLKRDIQVEGWDEVMCVYGWPLIAAYLGKDVLEVGAKWLGQLISNIIRRLL